MTKGHLSKSIEIVQSDVGEKCIPMITGSDLCFSIRSVLLVEEPAGEPLEERGVRGERRGSGSSLRRAVADFAFVCKTNEKPYIFENKGSAFLRGP